MHIYENSYSWQTFIERIVRAFTMTGSESLLGGFWFLISLFWASIISLLFLNMLSRKNLLTENNVAGGGVISILVTAVLWHFNPIPLPQMFGEQTLLATAFYLSGYLCRKKNMRFDYQLIAGLLLLIVPTIAAFFVKLNMATVQGWLVSVDYAIAMAGTMSIVLLSRELSRHRIAPIFAYIGDKTLYILAFHFLAFKPVSFVYLHFNGLPIDLLTMFPVLEETNSWMWIVYVISGIIFPLAIWELIHHIFVSNKTSTSKKYI